MPGQSIRHRRGRAMSDGDITEQLRIAAPLARAHMDSTDLVGWPIRFILLEAAAEIERLRQELQGARNARPWTTHRRPPVAFPT